MNFSKLFSNNGIFCIILGIIILLMTIYLVEKYIIIAKKLKVIDLPNHRSSHKLPTPRGGGIVIAVVSQLITFLLYKFHILTPNLAFAFSCGFILAMIGFIDDLINLSIKIRLFAQLVISFISVYCILSTSLVPNNLFATTIMPIDFMPHMSFVFFIGLILDYINQLNLFNLNNFLNFSLSLFLLMWSINLFNFMDGTDGLAGTEAICVLFLGGMLVYLATQNIYFPSYLFLISFIILGFLKFNFPPAKVFMGDVGSYFLGFFIGLSILISHYVFEVSLLYWLILYAVFLVDSTFTLIKRIISGKEWYKPHREHAYQKMQSLGWGHKKILYGLIIVNSFLGIITLLAYYTKHLLLMTIVTYLFLGTLYLYIQFKRKKYEESF